MPQDVQDFRTMVPRSNCICRKTGGGGCGFLGGGSVEERTLLELTSVKGDPFPRSFGEDRFRFRKENVGFRVLTGGGVRRGGGGGEDGGVERRSSSSSSLSSTSGVSSE